MKNCIMSNEDCDTELNLEEMNKGIKEVDSSALSVEPSASDIIKPSGMWITQTSSL